MNNFNKLYQTICEDEIFKASTPEEGIRRKQQYVRMKIDAILNHPHTTKNPDGSYDVDGDVFLVDMGLTNIPVKFNDVKGDFICSGNLLITLDGSPRNVDDFFNCSDNLLSNLKGSPRNVGGSFDCGNNNLTALEGAPDTVGGYFDCYHNRIKFTREDVNAACKVKGYIYV